MSLWRRIFGARATPPPVDVSEPAAPEREREGAPGRDPELEALRRGESGVRIAALRRLQGTIREREALAELARVRAVGDVPDDVLVAAADLHVQRGELDSALELLRDVGSPAGVLLAADLHAERGSLARALTLVERVLARDIDSPGARERHERYARQLGSTRRVEPSRAEATLLRPEASSSELRITEEAGRGGAGTVFQAEDPGLARRVALKVYHRPAEDQDQLVREARTAIALASPGVVRVFDADPAKGFVVMEWLGRGSLKEWLSRPDLAALTAYPNWFPQLVETVAEVHGKGWVHADLKPANILFREGGFPVVSDFGLAQHPGRVAAGGSLGYLSPERIAGQPLRASDDVFALGRILEDVLDRLRDEDPAVCQAAWRDVVRCATAEASVRPRDATELLATLPQLLPDQPC